MIYDPTDLNMALREDLTLMYLAAHDDGTQTWVPLHEVKKASNRPDDYTRPAW
jgi:hypothetical protein